MNERAAVKKFYVPLARFGDSRNLKGKFFIDRKARADFALFARANEHLPFVEAKPLQQEHFHSSTVFRAREHPRGQNFGTIDDEHVALFKVIDDVAENPMLYRLALSVVNEQPRRIARLGGRLRDQRFGQLVKIIACFQTCVHISSLSKQVSSAHAE